jgi:transcriptional regulator with XRE-family HTH domain
MPALPSALPPDGSLVELGRRIAGLRARRGWTQQQLADRLAMSRTAVSHLESGLSQPSERTVTVLAGLFRVEPFELVAGTAYPMARAERLPLVAARYTEVELQLALLEADLRWAAEAPPAVRERVLETWTGRLRHLATTVHDAEERALVEARLARLGAPRASS